MIKIGIIGAHGVGKTTFCLQYASDCKNSNPGKRVEIVSEIARSCPFEINDKTTREAQRWIFHRQILTELEKAARSDVLVCDRTVLDNIAYSVRAGFDDLVESIMPEALSWWKTYDTVFWLRPGPQTTSFPDGIRMTTAQTEIDQIIETLIIKNRLHARIVEKSSK